MPSCWLVFLPSRLFLSSFCCSSAGHIIGLTAPPANKNSNLVPSEPGRLPERMFVFVSFRCAFPPFIYLFPFLFCPLTLVATNLRGTWYMNLLRVSAKNSYTLSLSCQKRVHYKAKYKSHARSPAIREPHIVPVFGLKKASYTCFCLLCLAFNCFGRILSLAQNSPKQRPYISAPTRIIRLLIV